MIRTLLIARFLGATIATDGFQIASGIMFFFFLFIETALEFVAVPAMAKVRDDSTRFKEVVWGYLFKLLVLCGALTIVLVLSKPYLMAFLVPENSPALRDATDRFLPMMILGSIAYVIYRFICLVERAQHHFKAEIISDLLLSCVLTIYITISHADAMVLGESYLVANLIALLYITWRSNTMRLDLFRHRRETLASSGTFLLMVASGLISSGYIALEKKLGANAPAGALSLYAYASLLMRFPTTYGGIIVQIFHPSFHDSDGKNRFMQAMKLMWLYSIPVTFIAFLSSDLIVHLLFSSKELSEAQLHEMSLSVKILSVYLFTELTGSTQIRYLIAHGGLKVYNCLFVGLALVSFFTAYYFNDVLSFQVIAVYNLMTNALMMICVSFYLQHKLRLLNFKSYSYLAKLAVVSAIAFALTILLGYAMPINPSAKTILQVGFFTVLVGFSYWRWIEDEINEILYAKIRSIFMGLQSKVLRR